MGTLFRSQEMTLCQFYLQSEAAYCCVAELGEVGVAQFRDLNVDVNAFQRKFVHEIRRCDDMERILHFLEKECHKEKVPILRLGGNPMTPLPRELVDFEATLQKLEEEMKEVNINYEALEKNASDLVELKYLLRRAQTLFEEDAASGSVLSAAIHSSESTIGGLIGRSYPHSEVNREGQVSFIAGTILQQKIPAFERLIWRISRGTVLLRYYDIETELRDPQTGDYFRKSSFFAFFQGEQLRQRVKKICDAFRVTVFPCPDSAQEIREMAIQVMTRIEDLQMLLSHTQDHRRLVIAASAKNIDSWSAKIRKIKAVYVLMNCFNIDITQRCFVGEAWCPVADLDRIRISLAKGTAAAECTVSSILQPILTTETPPTYHKTNKFTVGFQGIVNAYGMAVYREVNPAPFTVITFPFLFAVMFGDFGHGLVMTLLALVLVVKEKTIGGQSKMGEIAQTIFGGRYIILLMGLFSLYTGLIYNDIFSKSFNIFGSPWSAARNVYNLTNYSTPYPVFQLDPNSSDYRRDLGPYPIGVDPIWVLSTNKINFINSYKMKMSVIMGVMQMLFGIVLSCYNHVYFKRTVNIVCEFIPQVIFLMCMFGYLCGLIFYKWIVFDASKSGCSPSLLIGLINMYLFKYEANPTPNGIECQLYTFYPHQKEVQTALVVIGVLCFPWMLFAKPFYMKHQASKVTYSTVHNVDDCSTETSSSNNDHGDGSSFSDIMIYQAIHTIEFCLGVVSNTASYLRLWALSLAHSQLSEVLWTMVMRKSYMLNSYFGFIFCFVVFMSWSVATLGILIFMEGMSAFLHALRLHWVEFQNKFYGGTGYAFEPFDFRTIDEQSKSATSDDK